MLWGMESIIVFFVERPSASLSGTALNMCVIVSKQFFHSSLIVMMVNDEGTLSLDYHSQILFIVATTLIVSL